MMIISSAKVENFEPFGKAFCSQHPLAASPCETQDGSLPKQGAESTNETCPKWKLQSVKENPDCYEELFVQNNTVVWSCGKSQKVRTIQKCYTAKKPVLDCLWSTFDLPSDCSNPAKENINTEGDASQSLCVVQEDCIDVLTKDGALFTITLPFPVSQVVSLQKGLLLERATTPGEVTGQKRDVPTVFSVMHPLDEPRPVTCKIQGKVCYICDPVVSVVFTCSDPALVMTYDSVIGLHSVWEVTKAKPEDCPASPTHSDHPPELPFSNILHLPMSVLSAGAHSRLSVSTPTQSFSPFRPYTPTSAIRAHVQSPTPIRLMSPLLSHMSHNRTMILSPAIADSPLGISLRSPLLVRSPPTSCSSSREESSWDSFQPLLPEVCLSQIWQETQIAVRHGTKGRASKAFITQDKAGASFLCYLLGQLNKLRGVEIIHEGESIQLVNPFEIIAKDAVPMERLNMMLVLEPNGTLVMYCGMVKGFQVHLPFFPVLKAGELSQVHTQEKVNSLTYFLLLSMVFSENRGIYISTVLFLLDMAAPVMLQELQVSSLRDAVSSTCNLELKDGTIYRMSLPLLSQNSAVLACLEALKGVIPASLVVQTHITCYISSQGPHSLASGGEWPQFAQCLLNLMGFPNDDKAKCDSPGLPAAKKSKTQAEDSGNSKAWELLMTTALHENFTRQEIGLQPINVNKSFKEERISLETQLNKDALLYRYIPSILFAWHLVYEDLKLDILWKDSLYPLARFLCSLAVDLGWHLYVEYYYRDFPDLFDGSWDVPSPMTKEKSKECFVPLCEEPPSIMQWLYRHLSGHQNGPFYLLPGATKRIFNVIMLYSLFVPMEDGSEAVTDVDRLFKCVSSSEDVDCMFKDSVVKLQDKLNCFDSTIEKVVAFLAENGLTSNDLERLPFGVAMPIKEALHQTAADPSLTLPPEAYRLIGREDLASMLQTEKKKLHPHGPLKKATLKEGEIDDGFNLDDEILSLRFGKDLRVEEIKRILQSSKPLTVSVVQKPEVSDHDFIQEQETRLLMMCKRTMALPVGRGMFTMATSHPVLTETLPIPPLDLTGRAPPRNTSVGLEHVETPMDMKVWPLFHNGVAAGLRIAQGISKIDSTWIVYNKPRNNQLTEEHAGFLMALGLSGHLNSLSYMNLHDYLCKGHELTTVGLLLGAAASKRGTMDVTTTKMLSIHIDALLPPTSAELDLPHSAQVAAILGVGLLYQGTAQRRMAEVLLSEIGRPPGPEMENAVNRESYSLAAGLALGLVMLEVTVVSIVADLKIADQLYHYMVGGQTKPQTGTQKEKFKSPSYQIKEGDSVNVNVTGPGATLALGLMFMKTNNSSVAAWLDAPDTQFLLDFIRPDFLLLRLLSRGLIMWDHIYPSTDWVESHIPAIVQHYDSTIEPKDADIDVESLSQAKVNIIAGCCMAMGLRFAGSANLQAFNCLMHYTKYCKEMLTSAAVEQAGKPTVETCLDTILLSLTMVMAGTGNLDVLRIARQLRKRHSPDVPYGSHMAVHMAVGLLFLGGGRFTLSTSGPAIAALVCAFYPRFPISSTDNRYHLQAFRHLYVLAAEPRVLVPREVDTKKACYVPLEVTLKETQFYPEASLKMTAPCILPELQLIKKVRVASVRYWPVTIDFTEDKGIPFFCFSFCLTYLIKHNQSLAKFVEGRNISEEKVTALCYLFNSTLKEKKLSSFIESALVESVTEEKPDVLKTLLRMWQITHSLDFKPESSLVWQMKLVITFYKHAFPRISGNLLRKPLVNADLITEYKFHLEDAIDRLMKKNSVSARTCYDANEHKKFFCPAMCCFAVYHDVPLPHCLPSAIQQG
ncbi:unnamed protein product, partial [Porites evermanni]